MPSKRSQMFAHSIVLAGVFLASLGSHAIAQVVPVPVSPGTAIAINDNRMPSGTRSNETLTLDLRAAEGTWRPEGPSGPALKIQAFGEGSSPLTIPAPLIRVREGTEIAATIRNELQSPMRVYGLC